MNYAVVSGAEILRVVYASPKSIEAKRAALKPGEEIVPCPDHVSDESHEWNGEGFQPKEAT